MAGTCCSARSLPASFNKHKHGRDPSLHLRPTRPVPAAHRLGAGAADGARRRIARQRVPGGNADQRGHAVLRAEDRGRGGGAGDRRAVDAEHAGGVFATHAAGDSDRRRLTPMFTFSETQLLAWLTPLLWPFIRVLALFSALPIFAQRNVPIRVRVGLALFIALCAQAALPAMPPIKLDSTIAL